MQHLPTGSKTLGGVPVGQNDKETHGVMWYWKVGWGFDRVGASPHAARYLRADRRSLVTLVSGKNKNILLIVTNHKETTRSFSRIYCI